MFTVTDNAASQLKQIMKDQEFAGVGVRVFVKHQCGCEAINPGMGFDDSLSDEDEVFDHDGVKFVVNKQAATTPEGRDHRLLRDGHEQRVLISNPNASGCGGGQH